VQERLDHEGIELLSALRGDRGLVHGAFWAVGSGIEAFHLII
jgi:hypothetical protein